MSWLKKQLTSLQNRPYNARLKILKVSVAVVVIVLLVLWVITIKYRSHPITESEQKSKFAPIIENLKKLKDAKR